MIGATTGTNTVTMPADDATVGITYAEAPAPNPVLLLPSLGSRRANHKGRS